MAYSEARPKREDTLLTELQHRVRSTLATTRMIARRSADTSDSLEDYVAHLDGRLAALARVQNAAIRDPRAGIELNMLVGDELTSAGEAVGTRVRFEGPTVMLHPRAADPFALALHELTTNAIKFGALSSRQGRLRITWEIRPEAESQSATLAFSWIESGLNFAEHVVPREGFGMVVLRQMLNHNLGAQTNIQLASGGLQCSIVLPLNERVLVSGDYR